MGVIKQVVSPLPRKENKPTAPVLQWVLLEFSFHTLLIIIQFNELSMKKFFAKSANIHEEPCVENMRIKGENFNMWQMHFTQIMESARVGTTPRWGQHAWT